MEISLHKKIRIEMIIKGITSGDIARKVNVTRSAINRTIEGKIKAYRLRKAIADFLGMKLTDLWPDSKVNK